VYSAVVVASVTLAVSYAVYSLATFHASPAPVYTESSFSVYGSPSFLFVRVNASSATTPAEVRVDGSSSLSGILRLTGSGYSNIDAFCAPGSTTFFSVLTSSGQLGVTGSGRVWIDGASGPSSLVRTGWHEIVIADGSGCSVSVPGSGQVTVTSPLVSPIPKESSNSRSFRFMIPYVSPGHLVTMVFDGGTQLVDF
jgi:hypothetical protein